MNIACNICGEVWFTITKKKAIAYVKKFNAYFKTLSPAKQLEYYKGERIHLSGFPTKCWCGGRDFRRATREDLKRANGHTTNAMLIED